MTFARVGLRVSGPWVVVVLAAALACGGCAKGGSPFGLPGSAPTQAPGAATNLEEVRSQVMSLSDSYIQTVNQSLDEMVAATTDPQKATWARGQRLATITVSMTNATGPNAVVGLLDMVVFATLKREAVEKYWLPNLLHEEGQKVVDAHRRGEEQAWAAARRVLSKGQCDQLQALIDQWRRDHPEQYYVGYTRFSDFDAYRNLSPQSPEAKIPGSLFSLFYVDPLAGLDPVARELRSYRALTERMVYIISRLPIVAAYQVDLAVNTATGAPEVRRFVEANEKFVETTGRLTNVVADYPKALSAEREAAVKQVAEATALERQAAIEQASKTIATEREAILKQLEAQDGRIRAIVGDVSALVTRAEQAGVNVHASSAQKISTTEQATRRTMDHAFWLTVALLVVLLVGVPLALLTYRVMNRRIIVTPAATR